MEELAFQTVQSRLVDIARDISQQQSRERVNFNAMKRTSLDRYKDIKIGIHGCGFVFGEVDTMLKHKTYQYSLRAAKSGSLVYLIDKKDFLKYAKQYPIISDVVNKMVRGKEYQMMKDLTRIVFNKWYADLLQENLKVVPDLSGEPNNDSIEEEEVACSMPPAGNIVSTAAKAKSPPLVGLSHSSAEEIIQRTGTKIDIQLLREK